MAEYKYECAKVRIHDGIAWLTMNRPGKRNAMSPQLHYDMDDALARLEVDEDVRVVVVGGEGGNFSAGQDLQKFFRELERNPGERKKAAAAANRAERLMKKSPAVLRATKHCIRHVRTMDVPQAYDYLAAKGQAIKTADKEDSYNTGLRQFLDEKSYKPTYEPFKLGTLLTDQTSAKK